MIDICLMLETFFARFVVNAGDSHNSLMTKNNFDYDCCGIRPLSASTMGTDLLLRYMMAPLPTSMSDSTVPSAKETTCKVCIEDSRGMSVVERPATRTHTDITS